MDSSAGVRLRVLGPVRAWRAGSELDVGPVKQQAVLAALVLRPGVIVPPERLLDDVWRDERPESGHRAIAGYVHRIRRSLGDGVIQSERGGYRFDSAGTDTDVARLAGLTGAARAAKESGDWAAALGACSEALRLYEGEPLTGLPGPLADGERRRLNQHRFTLSLEKAECLIGLSRYAEAASELGALLTERPYDEPTAGWLMRALYGDGRPHAALAVYDSLYRSLADLGMEPGQEIRGLQQAVLRHNHEYLLGEIAGPAGPRVVAVDGLGGDTAAESLQHVVGAERAKREPTPGETRLYLAAEELAGQVRKQWEREERVRRVHAPYPLPVRFEAAQPGLCDHWANIRKTGRGTDPGPLPLAGDLDEIAAVFGSIPSERLVVLGQGGSGKTILALRFVLDRLSGYSPGDRVPVIFSLGSWDPADVSLHDWMCRQLVRDYNALEAPAADGGNTAAALINNHHILPVLDGFDEIASGLQGMALAALNEYAGPLLLTSRPAADGQGLPTGLLTAAACIELKTLELKDVDEYLTRASRPGTDPAPRTGWEPVLSRLRAQAKGDDGAANVASALATPLMVAMARAVYSDAPGPDPAELLRTNEFPTADAVQKHLLAEFVPAAYRRLPADAETVTASRLRRPRRWNGERAEHWLGYLAWHMEEQERHNPARDTEEQGRHDLAWWELGTVMGQRALMLVVGVTVAVASGLVAGLVYGSAAALASGPASGLRTAIVTGTMNGLGVGLTFGLMHGFASNLKVGGPVFEPSHMRIRLRGGTRKKLREGFWPRISGGFVGGVLFGVLWVIGSALNSAVFPDSSGTAIAVEARNELLLGTGLGVAIGLVAAIGSGLEAVSEQEEAPRPSALLTGNRINVLTQLLAVAVVIGIGYGAVLGPVPGLAAGLIVALGLGTMTAWGRWVVLARIWLPLRGQAPWAMVAFLEDAYQRGVLRQAGAVYQFRHASVRIQLAEKFAKGR